MQMAKKEAGFSTWLQRVRRTGEFSDVKVCVNGDVFRLHMLPLLNASAYFRNLPSSSNGSPSLSKDGCTRIINITDFPGGVEGFSAIADFCYLVKPNYTIQNVAAIRAAAEFLGVVDVLESTKKFLYANIFVQWQASVSFLRHYRQLGSPVDEYVEIRCMKVIVVACAKAFGETKHLTAPMFLASRTPGNQQTSPCQTSTEILVQMSSLPDSYASEVINALVDAEVNLNLKCRQGRSVRSWLNSLIDDNCQTDRARCWVVLCLSRMLIAGAPENQPWMELSSQYWCTLLEHVDHLMTLVDGAMKMRLSDVKKVLEHRIGVSLDELDDYLHCYRFGPETLMSMISYYVDEADPDQQSLEEVAGEVDGFLWNFAETGSIAPDIFLSLFKAFPASCRQSHDTTYASIEKLLAKRTDCSSEDRQQLWRLVDPSKLSPAVNEAALNNPGFLSQPHILESVLQHHSEELSNVDVNDGQNLRHIMQKVINASLKLLEESSRHSNEIVAAEPICRPARRQTARQL
ncbi:unnamed protein product [Sphagnum troendelagicum]|uniref:BTB/POZ domain-containing protein n=1 Tax=Sphagnum troendelagicum TaxID=128251 RepID=A0ABP0V362_9BRYO